MNKSLTLIFLIFHYCLIAQQTSYPYGYEETQSLSKLKFMNEDEIVFIQRDDSSPFLLILDHISLETLEIIATDTMDISEYLGDDIQLAYTDLFMETESGLEIFGVATTNILGEFQKVFRIKLDSSLAIMEFDISDTDMENIEENTNIGMQKAYQSPSGAYYLYSMWGGFLYKMDGEWDFISSAYYPQMLFDFGGTGIGTTFNGFYDNIMICIDHHCLNIDSNLEIQDTSFFNTYVDWGGETMLTSFFSNSSINIDNSSFLIQAISSMPEILELTFDNLIWKIDSNGNVVDSTFIQKLGTDELHTRNFLRKDDERIYSGSVMRNDDTEIFGPAGDSLFFFAVDENLDSLWSSSYGSDLYYYKLHGLEADNHCLIAYGIEIPIEAEPWELGGQFFLLKYTWEELGLTLDELSAGSKEMNIYPNPASNLISIKMNGESGPIKSISAYDLMGNLVYSKELNNKEKLHQEIDISLWAKGMYVLKVFGKKTSFSSKFIKE